MACDDGGTATARAATLVASVKWSVFVAGVNSMLRGIDRISEAPSEYETMLAISLPSGAQLVPPLFDQIELLPDWHWAAAGFEEHLFDAVVGEASQIGAHLRPPP